MHRRGSDYQDDEEAKQSGDWPRTAREALEPSRASRASGHWTPSSHANAQSRPEASGGIWTRGLTTGDAHDDDQHTQQERVGAAPGHRRDHHAWLVAHTTTTTHTHYPETLDAVAATATQRVWRHHGSDEANRVSKMEHPPHPALWTAFDGMQPMVARVASSEYVARDGLRPPVGQSPTFDSPASQRSDQATHSSTGFTWPRLASGSNTFSTSFSDHLAGDSDADLGQGGEDETLSEDTELVPKASRYLREMDRRVILDRLARGEKQATLAKEYSVSRAAICNLFKHRDDVLARADENPLAKHPKKKKTKSTATPPAAKKRGRTQSESDAVFSAQSSSTGTTASSLSGFAGTMHSGRSSESGPLSSRSPKGTLHVLKTAALQLLLSALSDRNRSLQDFKRNSERVLWLILEEALALVPVKQSYHASTDTEQAATSYEAESPPCAISMETQTVHATPMLDIFQLMEPHRPCGTAAVSSGPEALAVEIANASLPHSLRGYNVFVVDVVAASGEAVCVTIERLLRQYGVMEASVTVVSLFASSEVIAMVQCKYPLAKIVTARIDSTITRRRIALTPVDLLLHRMRQAYAVAASS